MLPVSQCMTSLSENTLHHLFQPCSLKARSTLCGPDPQRGVRMQRSRDQTHTNDVIDQLYIVYLCFCRHFWTCIRSSPLGYKTMADVDRSALRLKPAVVCVSEDSRRRPRLWSADRACVDPRPRMEGIPPGGCRGLHLAGGQETQSQWGNRGGAQHTSPWSWTRGPEPSSVGPAIIV
jgi:hypothetical protein